ncbi:hypothetical protein GPECTOR_12g436 [Gonium pectorale]|uniref:NF-kappa-B inhibitor-like protein 1 n=1 Tax=Gonium pectorale TaxID=33097 RepID=A0A150GNQ8_GONPE|nr:hypothetical protein GPECTOR_12g436 [Gonium pectorale]|eukprot:KXZ51473.1 hypothetical protein GPECTOR_12g436 [Gonium pectorale]
MALRYASSGRAGKLRKLLRRAGSELDLSAPNAHGRTLLHQACACGDPEVVAALLRHGAPAAARDGDGDTPAHVAARGGHLGALAELMRAPDAPPLDSPGAGGRTLRELMSAALAHGAGRGDVPQAGLAADPAARQAGEGGGGEASDDEEARWRRRLREEASDGEGAGGDGDGVAEDDWGGGAGSAFGASGEDDDAWADRLWQQMQRRRRDAAAASAASFAAELRAENARRAAEAAERSTRILRDEQAKDAEWRRRTLLAIEAGPSLTPLDVTAARVSYDERWAQLDAAAATAAASAATPPLRYTDIPWPLEPPPGAAAVAAAIGPQPRALAGPSPPPPPMPPPTPTAAALRDFLLLGVTGPGDVKRRLRAELLRWHPDKFGARFGARLAAAGPAQREAALARVQQLAAALTQILSSG